MEPNTAKAASVKGGETEAVKQMAVAACRAEVRRRAESAGRRCGSAEDQR